MRVCVWKDSGRPNAENFRGLAYFTSRDNIARQSLSRVMGPKSHANNHSVRRTDCCSSIIGTIAVVSCAVLYLLQFQANLVAPNAPQQITPITNNRPQVPLQSLPQHGHAQDLPQNSEFVVQYTPSGCVYTPADTSVCAVDNVCFENGLATYHIAPFGPDKWPWGRERNISGTDERSLREAWDLFERICCNRLSPDMVKACVRAHRLGFTCCRQSYKSRNEPRLLNGSVVFQTGGAMVMDTAVNFFQFGHAISKILQYASLALWAVRFSPPNSSFCERPVLSMGVFSRIEDREYPSTIQEWLELVARLPAVAAAAATGAPTFTTLTRSLIKDGASTCTPNETCEKLSPPARSCVQRAYYVRNYEQYFFRGADAEQLKEEAQAQMDLPPCPRNNTSARRRVMMLVRTEGSFGRKFLNAKDVEDVVSSVLNLPIDKVAISSSMTAREQATEFRNHGFVVSPHSSQLKNLALACPCTVAVEINAMEGARDPFGVGVEYNNITFLQSNRHTAETYGRSVDASTMRNVDVTVNLTKLKDDLAAAIAKHRHSGCHVF